MKILNYKQMEKDFNNDGALLNIFTEVLNGRENWGETCEEIEKEILGDYDNRLTILSHYCYDDKDTYVEALPRFRKDLQKVYNGEYDKELLEEVEKNNDMEM